jgi:hypothetical protein
MIHIVKQGEHLSGIAKHYGFTDFKTIWDRPENAELKEKRKNPNILYPGDKLFVPDKEEKEESGETEERHHFKLKGTPLLLRLVIKDLGHKPLANTPCELHVEGRVHELTTDDGGQIEQPISKDAKEGFLLFKDPQTPFDRVLPIKIGHLDPVEELSGQKARLNNLGYDTGPMDETDDEKFQWAVQEFQCDEQLTVDGACGPKTQARLKERHGC